MYIFENFENYQNKIDENLKINIKFKFIKFEENIILIYNKVFLMCNKQKMNCDYFTSKYFTQ